MPYSLLAAKEIFSDDALKNDFLEQLSVTLKERQVLYGGTTVPEKKEIERTLEQFINTQPSLLSIPITFKDDLKVFTATVLEIKGGKFSQGSPYWNSLFKTLSSDVKKNILSAISSVGRVQLTGTSLGRYLGTAWFIKNNIMVTNSHVAHVFSESGDKASFPFVTQGGHLLGAKVEMHGESESQSADELTVKAVKLLSSTDNPDVAFLEVSSPPPKRYTLELSDALPNEGEDVAVIGFPGRDTGTADPDLVRKIFGELFDFKRFQLGKVVSTKNNVITHTCPTLKGNSGSPLISLKTGKVVGLHYGGTYLEFNYAIPASMVNKLVKKHL
jgi:V8-like Glu-specific endopeptidase